MFRRKIGSLLQLGRQIAGVRIGSHAAHTCFFMVLSAFPALLLMLGALRYTPLGVEDLIRLLSGYLPQTLTGMVRQVILDAVEGSSGRRLSISVAAALWSASRGIRALQMGLDAIYGCPERRKFWKSRLWGILYTLLLLVILLLSLGLRLLEVPLHRLAALGRIPFPVLLLLTDCLFLPLLQAGLFTLMYMFLPSRRNGFSDSLPGALLAALGWMIFSELFTFYAEHIQRYSGIYGSVYVVALGMLWLYCCIGIVFFGGWFNGWRKESKRV